jgi:hypothetical protein
MYMIEYFIIQNNPDDLDNYLKLNRIPNAKNTRKKLKILYKKYN